MKLNQIISEQQIFEDNIFSNIGRVNDWRNYVGDFIDCWDELTLREKQIIFKMAQEQASNEEWE